MVHIILCRIKKEVGIINATFNMIFKYKGQLLTGTVKGDEAFIFSGHFFDRYKERFFKIHKENRLITDKDIMKVFFIFNSNCCFCNKEKRIISGDSAMTVFS